MEAVQFQAKIAICWKMIPLWEDHFITTTAVHYWRFLQAVDIGDGQISIWCIDVNCKIRNSPPFAEKLGITDTNVLGCEVLANI